jgi:hypothetical protein
MYVPVVLQYVACAVDNTNFVAEQGTNPQVQYSPVIQPETLHTHSMYPLVSTGPWHGAGSRGNDPAGYPVPMWQPCQQSANTNPMFIGDSEQVSPLAFQQQGWQSAQQERPGVISKLSVTNHNVWKLALDSKGCRLVQKELGNASSDVARAALASGLHTHVWEAIISPNANYVLQKCVSTMRPSDFQFIIDEILQQGAGAVIETATHQFGCRILQRLFEFSSPGQMDEIVMELLMQVVPLCKDMYASFVMQHLLQHGSDSHISALVLCLMRHINAVGTDPFSVSVLKIALDNASEQDQQLLARTLVAQPNLLFGMSSWRHGFHTAKLALEKVAPRLRQPALLRLQQWQQKLQSTRYGKKLFSCVQKLLQEEQGTSAINGKALFSDRSGKSGKCLDDKAHIT